jgi:hypothetical protein
MSGQKSLQKLQNVVFAEWKNTVEHYSAVLAKIELKIEVNSWI